jgi:hypothetical protein
MIPVKVKVQGLKEARENLQKLNEQTQTDIGREALRSAGWVLAGPMRAATYTTFKRQTGAIRSGLGVAVQLEPKDDALKAYVWEYPQRVGGVVTPFSVKVMLAKRRKARGGSAKAPLNSIAFWWRFLEFGTQERRSVGTPKFLRTGKIAKKGRVLLRQTAAASAWKAAAHRGAISGRSWLRPVMGSKGPAAIDAYRETLLKLIDAAISKMPKR